MCGLPLVTLADHIATTTRIMTVVCRAVIMARTDRMIMRDLSLLSASEDLIDIPVP